MVGDDQIWIAGGIGITPFISWIRSLDDRFTRSVDFYYCVKRAADALDIDEINAATAQHPSLRMHLIYTETVGPLTAETVMRARRAGADRWVYMCGPPPMMHALAKDLHHLGVSTNRIPWEQFDGR